MLLLFLNNVITYHYSEFSVDIHESFGAITVKALSALFDK